MKGTAMVSHELLQDSGVLILRPEGALDAADFQAIAAEVDPYIESHGKLNGMMIDAPSFPGWKDFAALVAHLKFVKDHHKNIKRIAAVSDSTFLSIAPKIASHFVQAEVRHLAHGQADEALQWLTQP
jgi:hypothetical protein